MLEIPGMEINTKIDEMIKSILSPSRNSKHLQIRKEMFYASFGS